MPHNIGLAEAVIGGNHQTDDPAASRPDTRARTASMTKLIARIRRGGLAIIGISILPYSAIYAAEKPPNAQAAYAAARVWAYILRQEAILGLCRQLDSARQIMYDRFYDNYEKTARPMMGRISGIIVEEAIRSGLLPEESLKRLDRNMPRLIARDLADTNPSLFIEECRNRQNISAEEDVRAVDPKDLNLIKEWR